MRPLYTELRRNPAHDMNKVDTKSLNRLSKNLSNILLMTVTKKNTGAPQSQ